METFFVTKVSGRNFTHFHRKPRVKQPIFAWNRKNIALKLSLFDVAGISRTNNTVLRYITVGRLNNCVTKVFLLHCVTKVYINFRPHISAGHCRYVILGFQLQAYEDATGT